MEMIPVGERSKYACHFCDNTLSVKYIVTVVDPMEGTEPQRVPCCNKCAALFGYFSDKPATT